MYARALTRAMAPRGLRLDALQLGVCRTLLMLLEAREPSDARPHPR